MNASTNTAEIGMIGLGVMGRNFLLNLADSGFPVIGFDLDDEKVRALCDEANNENVAGAKDIEQFVGALKKPRTVMLLVPAGKPVDAVLDDLIDRLEPGDIVIDGGNSHFRDTQRRIERLAEKRLDFMGVGVSGGEEGARRGPSLMPGGSRKAWERVRPMLEAAAAKVEGEPCVAHLGAGAAGHYVKMMHNGIEYGLMQLIAEAYDLMHRGWGMTHEEMAGTFEDWNRSPLSGFLVEITGEILRKTDEETGKPLVEVILDEAGQKGTGMWSSQDALELAAPIPTIDAAVAMRNVSGYREERQAAARALNARIEPAGGADRAPESLKGAFYAAMILTYAQGMDLLRRASEAYEFGLNLADVARIWRGGCIIRADLLETIRAAYRRDRDLASLLLDDEIAASVGEHHAALRGIVAEGARLGIPLPAFMASLGWLDAWRSERLPANMIQAQRDYFGAHTYKRLDKPGTFHTQWSDFAKSASPGKQESEARS